MTRFIAVHPTTFMEEHHHLVGKDPALHQGWGAGMVPSMLHMLAQEKHGEGVSWNNSFCAFEEGVTFCEWEAPDKQVLEAIFHKYTVPCDRIYEVRHFDPRAGTFD